MSSSDNGAGSMHSQTTIVLRPIGSSLPLGFFAFAIARDTLGATTLDLFATSWLTLG